MKRLICAILAACLLAAAASAEDLTGAFLFGIGGKTDKIRETLSAAGIVTLRHDATLPYWNGDGTFWEIGEDCTVEIGGEFDWFGLAPQSVRYLIYKGKLYAITFETDADSAAKDWKKISAELTAAYGEPEERSWTRENTVRVGGKTRKTTLYPHEYRWAIDEKTGIKVTVCMDKKGKVQKVDLLFSIQRRDMDETLKAADEKK